MNSPADRIPSHGTELLAQRYAFDFVMVDRRPGMHYHRAGWLRTLLTGVPTRECYAWGEPVRAPHDCVVVRAVDGVAERSRVHPIREAWLALKSAMTFKPDRLPLILGNHVITRSGDVFAAFVHLAPGTVSVSEGQVLRTGEIVGRVGHSGNSTTPHLHFQLMDGADPTVALPVPCAFQSYEVLRGDRWTRVEEGIPGRTERIRHGRATTGAG